MIEYTVRIIETLEREISVLADNEYEAEDKVRELYATGSEVLDAEDFTGVEFEVIKGDD